MSGTTAKPADGQKGSHVINVSIARRPGFFIYLAKQLVREHKVVELHSIGRAMEVNLRVSRLLETSGYVKFLEVETTKVLVDMRDGRQASKPKLIVKIAKADTYDQKMKEWEEVMEFNKAQAEKYNPKPAAAPAPPAPAAPAKA